MYSCSEELVQNPASQERMPKKKTSLVDIWELQNGPHVRTSLSCLRFFLPRLSSGLEPQWDLPANHHLSSWRLHLLRKPYLSRKAPFHEWVELSLIFLHFWNCCLFIWLKREGGCSCSLYASTCIENIHISLALETAAEKLTCVLTLPRSPHCKGACVLSAISTRSLCPLHLHPRL